MKPTALGRTILFCVDALLIDLGYYLAFQVRFSQHVPAGNLGPFISASPYISLLALALLWALELYLDGWRSVLESITGVIVVVSLLNVGTMALAFWLRGFAFPRTVFVIAPFLQAVFLISWRLLWHFAASFHQGPHQVVVVGNDGEATRFATVFADAGAQSVRVSEAHPDVDLDSLSRADVVYLTGDVPSTRRQEIISWCVDRDKELYLVPNTYDILLHSASVSRMGDRPVFRVEGFGLTPVQQVLKRVEDLILASVLVVLGAPLFPVVAMAIWATSPGPILYRQKRTGLGGETFYIYKFRTMVDGAEKMTGPVLASADDPRITPVGRFLRSTRLDEIPQVLNILKGEMSFVGPRPERPKFVEQFGRAIPAYAYRLKVKPGITGLAQVKGKYDTDAADKLLFDVYYICNYSLLLDLRILLQTVRVVLTPSAARGASEVHVGAQLR